MAGGGDKSAVDSKKPPSRASARGLLLGLEADGRRVLPAVLVELQQVRALVESLQDCRAEFLDDLRHQFLALGALLVFRDCFHFFTSLTHTSIIGIVGGKSNLKQIFFEVGIAPYYL